MNNNFFLAGAILVLVLLYIIAWKKDVNNVVFFALGYQWLQVNIKTIYCVFTNIDFINAHNFTDNIITSWLISNISLIVWALGYRIIINSIDFRILKKKVSKIISYDKLEYYYIVYAILTYTILNPFLYPSGFTQILVQFTYFKYSLFLVVFVNIIKKQDYKNKVIYFFLFEFLLSFSGFFSNFKDYLTVLIISYVYAIGGRIKLKHYIIVFMMLFLGFNLGVFWSFVKKDYRTFLTGGAIIQGSAKSRGESINYLYDKLKDFNQEQYNFGLEKLIDRMEYIDYFSACINYIPLQKPHEKGNALLFAVEFALEPRIFFTKKEVLDDSKYTAKYTGQNVTGAESATSISLGWAADGYIDFGLFYFFITPLLLGLLTGYVIKFLFIRSIDFTWGNALILPIYFQMYTFGNSLYKILPPILYFFVTSLLVIKLIKKYIIVKSKPNIVIN